MVYQLSTMSDQCEGEDMNKYLENLSKEQVLHLIVYQMFEKHITLDELTTAIKTKKKEIIQKVNEHLSKTL